MSDSAFGFKSEKDSPGFLLWQTTITWQRLIKKALDPHGVSHAQFVILAILLWFDENSYDATQGMVVSWSKLDKMTVSKSFKKLAALGYVNRIENELDTRAKSVSLTSKGKAMAQELVPIVEKVDADFFGTQPQDDQSSLIRILGSLITNH